MNRFLAFSFFLMALGLNGEAVAAGHAASATGHASAVIVTPLRVESITQLDFGYLLPNAHDGEVKITPTANRQIIGHVNLLPGLYAPATFAITGMPNVYYAVMTPSTLVFRTQNELLDYFDIHHPVSDLLVKDFTTFSLNLRGGDHRGLLGVRGNDLLSVGGTLVVPAAAAPGHYRGLVPISVAYQ